MKRGLPCCCAMAILAVVVAAACAQTALPDYSPKRQLSGNLRIWGSDQMSTVLSYWEEGFRKYQPNVTFSNKLMGTATAQYGLHEWQADLALSTRQIYPYEYYGLYRRSLMYPIEIAVATGSFNVPRKSFALGVFVNRRNPLTRLTVAQVDEIFGAHRTGGWQKLSWVTQGVERGPEKDIRTWGQLGLTGEWANKPIHVYGPPGIYPGGISFFQARVMGGADTWNESLKEFADRKAMMTALSEDPYGIAYTGICYETPQTKSLALADSDSAPYVALTRENVANRTYPLSRLAYIYFAPDRPNGTPADPQVEPKIEEFLTYVLSRQGQQEVQREGDYLPLTPDIAAAQMRELHRKHTPQNP